MSSSSRPSGDHRCSSGLRHDDDAIRPSVTGRQAGQGPLSLRQAITCMQLQVSVTVSRSGLSPARQCIWVRLGGEVALQTWVNPRVAHDLVHVNVVPPRANSLQLSSVADWG
jgi:hypothetical protein